MAYRKPSLFGTMDTPTRVAVSALWMLGWFSLLWGPVEDGGWWRLFAVLFGGVVVSVAALSVGLYAEEGVDY